MQPQSNLKDWKAPWRITGEFMFKGEEAGVWGQQKTMAGTHITP
jgi:hypothetical protein